MQMQMLRIPPGRISTFLKKRLPGGFEIFQYNFTEPKCHSNLKGDALSESFKLSVPTYCPPLTSYIPFPSVMYGCRYDQLIHFV